EKTFLASNGFPVVPFRRVDSLQSLQDAHRAIGPRAVLKTAGFGYDGKGQCRLDADSDLAAAWSQLGTGEAVLEGFIDFDREVSVVAARGSSGAFTHWGVVENRHANH